MSTKYIQGVLNLETLHVSRPALLPDLLYVRTFDAMSVDKCGNVMIAVSSDLLPDPGGGGIG